MNQLTDTNRRNLRTLRDHHALKRSVYLRAMNRAVVDLNVVAQMEMRRLADLENTWVETLDAVLLADVSDRFSRRRPNLFGRN